MMGYGYGNMMGGYGNVMGGYGYNMMGGYGNMMGGYGYNMIGAGGFGIISLILIITIAFAIYKLAIHGNPMKRIGNGNALEILNQRYARGEIDEEQYRKMRDTLTSK